jgi:hypothetical protein
MLVAGFSLVLVVVQGDNFSLLGTIGVDVNLFEGIALVGNYNTNFGSINGTNIGIGFEF